MEEREERERWRGRRRPRERRTMIREEAETTNGDAVLHRRSPPLAEHHRRVQPSLSELPISTVKFSSEDLRLDQAFACGASNPRCSLVPSCSCRYEITSVSYSVHLPISF
ncbi:unnamed protein product [Microthlaspi erraticum]|uniref:Uncharacterized protein n=1 Tax=Microthlaspi erraticum TaxID=1685480 RepID=A0A6D2IS64_9BRAS|nr:unnamed protein product [Microthlaspi erraticum]